MNSCQLEDVRAHVATYEIYGVTDDGLVDTSDYHGEGGGDADFVDEYLCDQCDTYLDNWSDVQEHISSNPTPKVKQGT